MPMMKSDRPCVATSGDRLLGAFNRAQDAIPRVPDGINLAGGTDAGKLRPDSQC